MQTAVVICPGRGTYNKAELGYLRAHFPDSEMLVAFDDLRLAEGQPLLTDLDGASRFARATHTRGDNASALIFASTLGDFLSIDTDEIEVVAVTGNSMGWYSALACARALRPIDGFRLANTMGMLMHRTSIGGQLIYPFVDDEWRSGSARREELLTIVSNIAGRSDHQLHLSIDLGGMLVLAGNEAGLAAFEKSVPPVEGRFPMRLANHAAFHTPLMEPVAREAQGKLEIGLFRQPHLPMVDGRGAIWWPHACNLEALYRYTLGTQIVETYDLTHAVTVAAREFAPDLFIVTGPGTTLGGAIAQTLVLGNWRGMAIKSDFRTRQQRTPLLVSMGMTDQRQMVTARD